MENARLIAATLALALAATPVGAGTLYKSVGPDGVIQFSDVPPGDAAKLIEQRSIESLTSVTAAAHPAGVVNAAQLLEADAAVARANEQVDMAEHALALARRSMWSELEGLKMAPRRVSATDVGRVEFYKRGVLVARQNLLDVLRERSTSRRFWRATSTPRL